MLTHLDERVRNRGRLTLASHIGRRWLEPARVKWRLVGVASNTSFTRVNNRRHLHVLLFTEAEDFALWRNVHLDFLPLLNARQRLRTSPKLSD